MKINPDDMTRPVIEQTRQAILSQAPEGLTSDERELFWIVTWINWKQDVSRASESFKIADPGIAERLRRDLPKLQREALAECTDALSKLEHHLNTKSDLDEYPMGPELWVVPDEVAEEIDEHLSGLRVILDHLKRMQKKPTKPSRPTGTASMYVRIFWPMLKSSGYSMRHAAKLLNNAFEKSELDAHGQAGTIYQTIRNLEV